MVGSREAPMSSMNALNASTSRSNPRGFRFFIFRGIETNHYPQAQPALQSASNFDSKIEMQKKSQDVPFFCRIPAALRHDSNSSRDFVGFLVVRNGHHRRDAVLFSIAIQFPMKLGVGGSMPVTRFEI